MSEFLNLEIQFVIFFFTRYLENALFTLENSKKPFYICTP